MAYTLNSQAEGKFLEQKYVTWDEVGLLSPEQKPGTLWSWGQGNSFNTGNIAQGDTVHRSSPTQVGSLTSWKQVINSGSSSNNWGAGLDTDGSLYVWGYNNVYQLGLSNTVTAPTPTNGPTGPWKYIGFNSQRSATVGLKTNGTLWSWGFNYYNDVLSPGTGPYGSNSPAQYGSDNNWSYLSVSDTHLSSIKKDGTLWIGGRNNYGGLGLGNTTSYNNNLTQLGSLTDWKQVCCGPYLTFAIKTNGTLWAWGYNNYYSLGLGDTTPRSSPVQVGSLTDWKQVAVNGYASYAIKTDGTLWSWGQGTSGQLGHNSTGNVPSPTQVGALNNWRNIYSSYGTLHMLATKTDGTLWAWGGSNLYGELGQGNRTAYSSPVQVGSLTNWKCGAGGNAVSFAIRYTY